MAEHRAVWGIDIGQAGLKAIRLKYADAAGQVLAVAFDYIPHPKILSQPDAIPEELVGQALDKFLERNDLAADAVAISVPGQSALTRFIQLPPVESSKVGEIVKYEARQQIPFALEDVVWQWQVLGGGVEESGFMLEAEVGLFAMKRDQVMQHLRPFTDRGVEVDLIQIAPLGLYNYLVYDRLGIRPDDEEAGQDEHTIVLDMGADNTTLLVSNGAKIWIRNVPIGGNHFTRALTKEMKLTFAKAEHLKCNATKAPDPRAVFQALRPVFNDYVAEIQRSIGYFSSVNRDAKINKVLGLGNGFKLAGLQKFLQQNLQFDVERVDSLQSLQGDNVLGTPLFEDNLLSFAVPYGIALQLLEQTRIQIDLLPDELKTARKIREKKPWAVLTAAVLLAGLAISTMGYAHVRNSVVSKEWDQSVEKAKAVRTEADGFRSDYTRQQTVWKEQDGREARLLEPGEDRLKWGMMHRAIAECLPREESDTVAENNIAKKKRIKLLSVLAKKVKDVSAWYRQLDKSQTGFMRAEDEKIAPKGPGYIFTLKGVHYYEAHTPEGKRMNGTTWVRNTLMANLRKMQHLAPGSKGEPVPIRLLGITHPVIVLSHPERKTRYVLDRTKFRAGSTVQGQSGEDPFQRGFRGGSTPPPPPGVGAGSGGQRASSPPPGYPASSGPAGPAGPVSEFGGNQATSNQFAPNSEEVLKYSVEVPLNEFVVQFVWQPVPPEKQRVFQWLARYFEKHPKGSFNGSSDAADKSADRGAKQFVESATSVDGKKKLQLSQELYDEFVQKHHSQASDYKPPPKEESEETVN